jgi:hypothetical protein
MSVRCSPLPGPAAAGGPAGAHSLPLRPNMSARHSELLEKLGRQILESGSSLNVFRATLRGAVHGRALPVDQKFTEREELGSSGGQRGRALLQIAAAAGRLDCCRVLRNEFCAGQGGIAEAAAQLAEEAGHREVVAELRPAVDAASPAPLKQGEVLAFEPAGSEEEGEVSGTSGVDGGSARQRSRERAPAAADSAPLPAPKWDKSFGELSFKDKLRKVQKTPPRRPSSDLGRGFAHPLCLCGTPGPQPAPCQCVDRH